MSEYHRLQIANGFVMCIVGMKYFRETLSDFEKLSNDKQWCELIEWLAWEYK